VSSTLGMAYIRLYRKLYTNNCYTSQTSSQFAARMKVEDLPYIQLVDSTFYKPTVNESCYSAAVLINRQ